MYQSSEPLRIGYLEDDGYTQPSPSMARGVREVKALLEQAGHTVRHTHTHTPICSTATTLCALELFVFNAGTFVPLCARSWCPTLL